MSKLKLVEKRFFNGDFYIVINANKATNSTIAIANFISKDPEGFESFNETFKYVVNDELSMFPINLKNSVISDSRAIVDFNCEFTGEFLNGKKLLRLRFDKHTAMYINNSTYSKVYVALMTFENDAVKLCELNHDEDTFNYYYELNDELSNINPDSIAIIISKSDDANTLYEITENDFAKVNEQMHYTGKKSTKLYFEPNILASTNGCSFYNVETGLDKVMRTIKIVAACEHEAIKDDIVRFANSKDKSVVPNVLFRSVSLYYDETNKSIIANLKGSHLGIDSRLFFFNGVILDISALELPDLLQTTLHFSKIELSPNKEEACIHFDADSKIIDILKFIIGKKIGIRFLFWFNDVGIVDEFSLFK